MTETTAAPEQAVFAFSEAPDDIEVITGAGREPKFGKAFVTLTAGYTAETEFPSKWMLFPDDATDVSLRNSARYAGYEIELGKAKGGQRLFRMKGRHVKDLTTDEQSARIDAIKSGQEAVAAAKGGKKAS